MACIIVFQAKYPAFFSFFSFLPFLFLSSVVWPKYSISWGDGVAERSILSAFHLASSLKTISSQLLNETTTTTKKRENMMRWRWSVFLFVDWGGGGWGGRRGVVRGTRRQLRITPFRFIIAQFIWYVHIYEEGLRSKSLVLFFPSLLNTNSALQIRQLVANNAGGWRRRVVHGQSKKQTSPSPLLLFPKNGKKE